MLAKKLRNCVSVIICRGLTLYVASFSFFFWYNSREGKSSLPYRILFLFSPSFENHTVCIARLWLHKSQCLQKRCACQLSLRIHWKIEHLSPNTCTRCTCLCTRCTCTHVQTSHFKDALGAKFNSPALWKRRNCILQANYFFSRPTFDHLHIQWAWQFGVSFVHVF